MMDETNITMFPQTLAHYPDMFIMDISGAALNSAGAHYKLGMGTLALYFRTGDATYSFAPVVDPAGSNWATYDQKIDLYYAMNLGAMLVGAELYLHGNSHEKDFKLPAPGDKSIESVSGLGIRLGATFMEAFEAYFNFHSVSWTNENASGTLITEPTGNTTIGLGGRFWMPMSDMYTLIPYVDFTMNNSGFKDNPGNETTRSTTTITIGCGDNIQVSEDVLLVSDLGIQLMPSTSEYSPASGSSTESKSGNNMLPYFRLGMEAGLTSWMIVRMGAYKEWHGRSAETSNGDNKEYWKYANTNLYLGAGFIVRGLEIDIQMDPGFVTRGPNVISGQTGNIATRATLRYFWGVEE
jgi:hypothetical protein